MIHTRSPSGGLATSVLLETFVSLQLMSASICCRHTYTKRYCIFAYSKTRAHLPKRLNTRDMAICHLEDYVPTRSVQNMKNTFLILCCALKRCSSGHNPVHLAPNNIPRSKALKYFVLPIHPLNDTDIQSMSQLSQALNMLFNPSPPLQLHD